MHAVLGFYEIVHFSPVPLPVIGQFRPSVYSPIAVYECPAYQQVGGSPDGQ